MASPSTLVAATIPLLAFAPTPTLIHVGALLFGIGLGGDYMIIPLMAAELFGLALMGRVMGIVLTADGVAEALVPMAVAATRDRAGSVRVRPSRIVTALPRRWSSSRVSKAVRSAGCRRPAR